MVQKQQTCRSCQRATAEKLFHGRLYTCGRSGAVAYKREWIQKWLRETHHHNGVKTGSPLRVVARKKASRKTIAFVPPLNKISQNSWNHTLVPLHSSARKSFAFLLIRTITIRSFFTTAFITRAIRITV